jgi:hypothetical protein
MSTRERWIVYPLLFLALGTAIKPKLVPLELRGLPFASGDLNVNRIKCRDLIVEGKDGEPRILMAASSATGGGVIHVIDDNEQTVVAIKADAETRCGLVETLNEHGRPQAVMMSSASGGEIVAYDNVPRRAVGIGHRDGKVGLIETNLQTDQTFFAPFKETPSK